MFKSIWNAIFGSKPETAAIIEPVIDKDSLEAALLAIGCSAKFSSKLAKKGRNAATLTSSPVENDSDIPIGASKIGGSPDLPADNCWPIREAFEQTDHSLDMLEICYPEGNARQAASDFLGSPQPLSFLCQINLKECSPFTHAGSDIPNHGLLLFFYDFAHGGWGFSPQDAPGFHILYFENPESFIRVDMPKKLSEFTQEIKPMLLTSSGYFQPLPWDLEPSISNPKKRSKDANRYLDLLEILDKQRTVGPQPSYDKLGHQLGGWEMQIQGPMKEKCALVTNGVYCGSSEGYGTGKSKEILAQPNSWNCLFQINSDEDRGVMWGDTGMLYFWIKQEDLKRRDFSKPWCILQCY